MRRIDRQLSKEEAEKILSENEYGILSVVCEDGYPYGLPLNYVYENGKLYFHHTSEQSLLADNISEEAKACFTVIGNTEVIPAEFSTNYESVIVFGTVKENINKYDVLMKLVKRFCPDFLEKGEKYAKGSFDKVKVYQFEINQITGKARKANR